MVVNSLDDADDDDDDVHGDCQLIGGAAGGGLDRSPDIEAKRQRDYLIDYVNDEGAVSWQDALSEYNCYSKSNKSGVLVPDITTISQHMSHTQQTDKRSGKHNSPTHQTDKPNTQHKSPN